MIYNYINFIINKPKSLLFFIFTALLISSLGLSNFKLDASSDALVLENDSSYKIYRESGDEFGNSDFLIVTYTPFDELFSSKSLSALKSLENELGNLKGVDNVFSLLDAPIFFQPKVPLTDVADNLKDLESPSINLLLAKEEFLNNPIYKELILSSDGKTTALQVVITSNTKKNTLINDRYLALDAIKKDHDYIDSLNKEISLLNEIETKEQTILVNDIRNILQTYRGEADLFLGGPSMIAVDMMSFIKSDLTVFGIGVALIFAFMLYLFFGNFWFVFLPLLNAFITTVFTAGILGLMNWKISVVSSNFIALLMILTISLTVHVMVRYIDIKTTNKNESLINSFTSIFMPCFFAALTTAVAFLSLILGDLKPVIEFGKMMAVGMSFALIFTFSFLPAALATINTGQTKDFINIRVVLSKLVTLNHENKIHIAISYFILFILFFLSKFVVLTPTPLSIFKSDSKYL